MRFKYVKTVELSALQRTGFDRLMDFMTKEVAALRKLLSLRIPQSEYARLAEVISESRIVSQEYEENDIVLEVEVPLYLERKLLPFVTHVEE
jgi:GTP-binding protein HflX